MKDPGSLTSSDGETYSDGTQNISYDYNSDGCEQCVEYYGEE